MVILELGLIYGLVALGVFITFRLLKFSDLTVDSSFTFGAFIAAYFMNTPNIGLAASFIFGGIAGLLTAILHNKLKMADVLASILVQLALYSINLRIMGAPNVVLNYDLPVHTIILCLTISTGALIYLLNTIFGLRFRASGQNTACANSLGISVEKMKTIGLILANGLVGLAGGLMAFYQGFADINLGIGTLITGLAAVIIGEQLFKPSRLSIKCLACIGGALIYRLIIHYALKADFIFKPSDLNLITAGIVITLIAVSKLRRSYVNA
ncbi:MAG: ABC transporter permease [Alphaproteobacteria bacterium]|nr:MAG: ABC transporter permease [Alphaproteobacteria bacterium]